MVDSWFPAQIPKPAGNYRGKSVEDWSWKDFKNYYTDKYTQETGKLAAPCYKQAIESAIELRGKTLLKAMIDWMFDNRRSYPKWTNPNLGLCMGTHGWAELIAEQAQKSLDSALEITDEEL